MSADNQLTNIRRAVAQLALVADSNDIVLTHGNGPQVGLLALQSLSYTAVQPYPLDFLGAQTEGMIGYLLECELRNLMPSRAIATDVDAVYLDFGLTTQRPVCSASPNALSGIIFPAGSMRPKIEAACSFVKATGKRAAIGSLENIDAMLRGDAGPQIRTDGPQVL